MTLKTIAILAMSLAVFTAQAQKDTRKWNSVCIFTGDTMITTLSSQLVNIVHESGDDGYKWICTNAMDATVNGTASKTDSFVVFNPYTDHIVAINSMQGGWDECYATPMGYFAYKATLPYEVGGLDKASVLSYTSFDKQTYANVFFDDATLRPIAFTNGQATVYFKYSGSKCFAFEGDADGKLAHVGTVEMAATAADDYMAQSNADNDLTRSICRLLAVAGGDSFSYSTEVKNLLDEMKGLLPLAGNAYEAEESYKLPNNRTIFAFTNDFTKAETLQSVAGSSVEPYANGIGCWGALNSDGYIVELDSLTGETSSVALAAQDTMAVFSNGDTKYTSLAPIMAGGDGDVFFFGVDSSTMAFYPCAESIKLNGNKLSVKMPGEYVYTGDQTGPMIGFADENGDLQFKHLWGKLRFTINEMPERAAKLVVSSHYWDSSLSGWFHIDDVTQDSLVLVESLYNGNSHDIVYNLPDTMRSGDIDFSIPLPPASYTNGGRLYPLWVILKDTSDNVLWKRPIYNTTIKRGVTTTLPAIDTKPKYVITSHNSGDTIKGYGAINHITIEGYLENYYTTSGQVLLTSQGNTGEGIIGDYTIKYDGYYNPQGLPTDCSHNGERHYFTLEDVEIRPGENVFAFDLSGITFGGDTIKGTKNLVINYEENNTPADKVDLGAAGVWASHNMGASKPEELGFPYKWADKTGTLNTHSTYIYMGDTVDVMSIAGDIRFDAATYKWGDGWKMPTDSDFVCLCENTTKEECSLNGTQGIKFTADNGNSIFLPYVEPTDEDGTVEYVRYWTSNKHYDVFQVYGDRSNCFGSEGIYYDKNSGEAVISYAFRQELLYIRPIYKK